MIFFKLKLINTIFLYCNMPVEAAVTFRVALCYRSYYRFCFVDFTDAIMLIKTKINNEQKYVKISEPSLDEYLNSG